MKTKIAAASLLIAVLVLQFVHIVTAAENIPEEALRLNRDEHVCFMDEQPDGLFHPYSSLLRSEAAQMVYSLLVEPPASGASYTDLPADAPYALPLSVLGQAELLLVDSEGRIRPDAPITRGEFAFMLRVFLSEAEAENVYFTDVPGDYWAHDAVFSAVTSGLFGGYTDGTFRPENNITRGEAAVVMCRLLGRNAGLTTLPAGEDAGIFPDVPQDFWAYGPIMEATVRHTYFYNENGEECWAQAEPRTTALTDGYYTIGNRLYRVQDGRFLHSTTADGFTYDASGRYTTGSDYLDQRLSQIVGAYTDSSMTRDEKLRALYDYTRDNYSYLKRGLVSKDAVGWENAYAEDFLKTGYGNCFSYAAAYCLMARQLGLPACTVVGTVGTRNVQDHGWVEIPLDGKTYLYDVELEWAYRNKNRKTDLFMVDVTDAPYVYTR